MQVIAERRSNPSASSYTCQLLESGPPRIGKKLVEEAAETWEAALQVDAQGIDPLVYEAADVIYHLFVMLAKFDVPLERVEEELGRRFGVSGLEEKASRAPKPQ